MVSFITIVFILSLVDVGESDSKHTKYIPCRTFLDHELEKSSMECSEDELIYVEKQVLLAGLISIENSEILCHISEGLSTEGLCAQTLPNRSEIGAGPFPVGHICNLQNYCVLDKDLIEKSVDVVRNTSCLTFKAKFKSTGLTYSCLKKKYIFILSENEMGSRVYQDEIYLVIDRFYGNLTCDLIGPTRDMHMLELTETSIDVYSNGTSIYNNNNTNLYGENIMQYLNESSDTGVYSLHLFIRTNGRVWLQLRGERLQVNCKRLSPNFYFLSTAETRINFTSAYTEKRSRGSNFRWHVLLVFGLVAMLTVLMGIYIIQTRKDQNKLNDLIQQRERISVIFNDDHVNIAADDTKLYSEISSTRTFLCF